MIRKPLLVTISLIGLVSWCASNPSAAGTPRTQEPVESLLTPTYQALSDNDKAGVVAELMRKNGGATKIHVALLTPLASRGEVHAQYMLGMIYASPSWRAKGSGIKQNDVKAHAWFIEAAAQGNSRAAVQVADDFRLGERGAQKDVNEAIKWYRVAAAANDAYAQRMIGVIYLSSGSPDDLSRGIEWMKKAAENGDEEAITYLYLMR